MIRLREKIEKYLPEINAALGTSYKSFEDIVAAGDLPRIASMVMGEAVVDNLKGRFPGGIPFGIHGPLHRDGGVHSHPFLGVRNSGQHRLHRRFFIGYRRSLHKHPESIMPERIPELMPHGHSLIPPMGFGFHYHYDLILKKIKEKLGR